METVAGGADEAARARLEHLFHDLDRLTPDELGRIGLRPADDHARRELREAVDAAARQTGRTALVAEATALARETVLRRYAEGTLRPTWVALNWGISSGTVDDRVAIVEALSDAAAVAVVEDVLDPEVAAALALDAGQVVGLAAGDASDGALSRVLEVPADPELGPTVIGRRARIGFAAVLAGGSLIVAGVPSGSAAVVAAGLVVAAVAFWITRDLRRRAGP